MQGGIGLAILLIGLVAIVPVPARAQGVGEVTVDELVARALADNPDLKAARFEVEASAGRLQQAGLRPNPMLELGGQKALSSDNNLNVGVSLPLDLNGRKEGRVGVAEAVTVVQATVVLTDNRTKGTMSGTSLTNQAVTGRFSCS